MVLSCLEKPLTSQYDGAHGHCLPTPRSRGQDAGHKAGPGKGSHTVASGSLSHPTWSEGSPLSFPRSRSSGHRALGRAVAEPRVAVTGVG